MKNYNKKNRPYKRFAKVSSSAENFFCFLWKFFSGNLSRKTKKRESLCPKFRVFFDTRKCALKVIHIMLCVNIRVRLSISTQKVSRLLETLTFNISILTCYWTWKGLQLYKCPSYPKIVFCKISYGRRKVPRKTVLYRERLANLYPRVLNWESSI